MITAIIHLGARDEPLRFDLRLDWSMDKVGSELETEIYGRNDGARYFSYFLSSSRVSRVVCCFLAAAAAVGVAAVVGYVGVRRAL